MRPHNLTLVYSQLKHTRTHSFNMCASVGYMLAHGATQI
jgi:hypothetical protein